MTMIADLNFLCKRQFKQKNHPYHLKLFYFIMQIIFSLQDNAILPFIRLKSLIKLFVF